MYRLRFEKYHGLGNDFLIAVLNELPGDRMASGWARKFCHRQRGIGADGMILATADPAVMRLWNSDGSSAEVSGNGLRCLAHALARHERVDHLDVLISTTAGPRHCSVTPLTTGRGDEAGIAGISRAGAPRFSPSVPPHGDGSDIAERPDVLSDQALVVVEMGDVGLGRDGPRVSAGSSDPSSVVRKKAGITVQRWDTADVGNPHIVLAVPDPHAVPLDIVGPAMEELFTDGINAHFVTVTDRSTSKHSTVTIRTWERGAGITEACGTGATAVAAVLHSWGHTGEHITAKMPGGNAEVELKPTITLRGPSVYIATIIYD